MVSVAQTPTQGADDEPSAPQRHTWVDVALIALVLATVATITIFVVVHFASNATNAATILGIVIPGLATVGAAIFGVRAAYSAGQAKGEATGTLVAADAAKAAQQQTAQRFSGGIEVVKQLITSFHENLQTQTSSPSGRRTLYFAEEQPRGALPSQEIDPTPLEQARQQLDRLEGVAATLTQTS